MKLIGSRTEAIRRVQLLNSESLINENPIIVNFLNKQYGNIRSVYALAHTPEQGVDIYRLIINGNLIIGFELSHIDNQISEIFDMSVEYYSKQLNSKSDKLDLAIVLDLANN
ncbi:hypothetical protein [Limnobaculum parvum]|uniref:Uncharacterized protein n=1 Tax=Limnobaculum parvum TaxID=2172103 RepID=A0A2Y9TYV5_9GAMM|nr:hypothetical protein [Limnobaculum parvum]AWH88639.1 hypothetical protein HYN51_08735 [Limnobaculum parvum]